MDGAQVCAVTPCVFKRPFLTSSSLGGLQACEAPPVTTHEERAVQQAV